ncbi:MAG: response regulator transcription factor [Cellulosilyticaceae bacterium]
MFHVLIVDDEKEIIELMEVYLKEVGYAVSKAYNGVTALNILQKEKIDLMILDIMMPGLDGIKVCNKVREDNKIPIIMVSAKGQDIDKITGLQSGADDYIVKPFSPLELVARVQSQLRRYVYFNDNNKDKDEGIIEVKGIILNKEKHKVFVLGKEIKLTPTEYGILVLLAENRGKVYSSEEIYRQLWKEKYFEGNNTVMAHMWRLREKIEENPKDPKIIETVWGVGYKIEED